MGVLTTLLKLLKPGENDYYNQQTEQADNWDKVDNYAVLTNTDKNGIWGGEYGGKIQDPIPKELNKRYIDNINGKAFICIKAGDSSVTSNTTEYFTPCNVVDNLGKLQNLVNGDYDIIISKTVVTGDILKVPSLLNYKAIGTINRFNAIDSYIPISKFNGKNRICIFTRATKTSLSETGLVDAFFTDENTIEVTFVGKTGGAIEGYDTLKLIGFK